MFSRASLISEMMPAKVGADADVPDAPAEEPLDTMGTLPANALTSGYPLTVGRRHESACA